MKLLFNRPYPKASLPQPESRVVGINPNLDKGWQCWPQLTILCAEPWRLLASFVRISSEGLLRVTSCLSSVNPANLLVTRPKYPVDRGLPSAWASNCPGRSCSKGTRKGIPVFCCVPERGRRICLCSICLLQGQGHAPAVVYDEEIATKAPLEGSRRPMAGTWE